MPNPKPKYYGVYNTVTKKFQFGIVAISKQGAQNKLFKQIGNDAHKWRFDIRPVPIMAPFVQYAIKNGLVPDLSQFYDPIDNPNTYYQMPIERLDQFKVFIHTQALALVIDELKIFIQEIKDSELTIEKPLNDNHIKIEHRWLIILLKVLNIWDSGQKNQSIINALQRFFIEVDYRDEQNVYFHVNQETFNTFKEKTKQYDAYVCYDYSKRFTKIIRDSKTLKNKPLPKNHIEITPHNVRNLHKNLNIWQNGEMNQTFKKRLEKICINIESEYKLKEKD